jgi:hypothetical protein
MGDGYCLHHNDSQHAPIAIGYEFFIHLLHYIKVKDLKPLTPMLLEDSRCCDECGGETSSVLRQISMGELYSRRHERRQT